MKPTIITSGQAFTDIDALACAVSYAELLHLEGVDAEVVLPGPLNHSITPTIKSWDFTYVTEPTVQEYQSVLVDVSEESHFAKCAQPETITEVFDHRYGFQDYWNATLGSGSHIELVGSCATLIWEEFIKRGQSERISATSANLLLVAIVSNTLCFKAQITHQRDIKAFNELQKYISLPSDWQETYFTEQEADVFADIQSAIISDTKVLEIPGLGFPIVMGQLELWDGNSFIEKHQSEIESALTSFKYEYWFMSVPSIKEGINYFYTKNEQLKRLLEKYTQAVFIGDTGTTSKLWLRKEVRAELLKGTGN